MASGRKAKGAFGLTIKSSEYKALDIAISKATNHQQVLPKEKHVRTIFYALSPSKPRCDVVYCIHSLAKRVGQTHNWTVALKTLIVIHRAMRELDNSVWEEFINYSRERAHMLNLAHFQDGSSPNALDYSAWIRSYAFYLDERLRCYVMLHYDAVTYSSKEMKLETLDLLEQLPSLQDLLYRLLQCQPRGAAPYNRLIQYCLSVVAGESVKLYVALTVRVVSLLDKFFEMNRLDALRALEIYRKSVKQGEYLSAFFETCRSLDFGRGQKFINIKAPPASFMATLEEYVKEAPSTLMLECQVITDEQGATAKENAAPEGDLPGEHKQDGDVKETSDPSQEKSEAVAAPQVADLLGLDDLLTGATEFEQNSYALAIVPTESSSKSGNDENVENQGAIGWELALFSEPSSNEEVVTEHNSNGIPVGKQDQAQGLDRSTLDSLYDEGSNGTQQNGPYQMGQVVSNPFEASLGSQGTFCASGNLAPPTSQGAFYPSPNMAPQDMSYQQIFMMQQLQHLQQLQQLQQQQLQLQQLPQQQQQQPVEMNQKPTNPFDESYMLPQDMQLHPPQDTNPGLL